MPKIEIIQTEATPLAPELRDLLSHYFKEAQLLKLERLGGRVLISVAAPYNKLKGKKEEQIKVDDAFIEQLRLISGATEELREQLAKLRVKQLRELAARLKQPVRSKATASEIRAELIKNFQSEDFWRKITDM